MRSPTPLVSEPLQSEADDKEDLQPSSDDHANNNNNDSSDSSEAYGDDDVSGEEVDEDGFPILPPTEEVADEADSVDSNVESEAVDEADSDSINEDGEPDVPASDKHLDDQSGDEADAVDLETGDEPQAPEADNEGDTAGEDLEIEENESPSQSDEPEELPESTDEVDSSTVDEVDAQEEGEGKQSSEDAADDQDDDDNHAPFSPNDAEQIEADELDEAVESVDEDDDAPFSPGEEKKVDPLDEGGDADEEAWSADDDKLLQLGTEEAQDADSPDEIIARATEDVPQYHPSKDDDDDEPEAIDAVEGSTPVQGVGSAEPVSDEPKPLDFDMDSIVQGVALELATGAHSAIDVASMRSGEIKPSPSAEFPNVDLGGEGDNLTDDPGAHPERKSLSSLVAKVNRRNELNQQIEKIADPIVQSGLSSVLSHRSGGHIADIGKTQSNQNALSSLKKMPSAEPEQEPGPTAEDGLPAPWLNLGKKTGEVDALQSQLPADDEFGSTDEVERQENQEVLQLESAAVQSDTHKRLGALQRTGAEGWQSNHTQSGSWDLPVDNLPIVYQEPASTAPATTTGSHATQGDLVTEPRPIKQNFQMFYNEVHSTYAHMADEDISFESAEEQFLKGNLQEACRQYHALIEKLEASENPDLDVLSQWLETLGDIYILLGDPEAAASVYYKARTTKPERAGRRVQKYLACLLKLTTKYEEDGRTRDAEAVYIEAIKVAGEELDEGDVLHQRINDAYVAMSRRKSEAIGSMDDQYSTVRLRAIEKSTEGFSTKRKPTKDITREFSQETKAYKPPEIRRKMTGADIEFAATKGVEDLNQMGWVKVLNSIPVQIVLGIVLLACGVTIVLTLGIGEKFYPRPVTPIIGKYKTVDGLRVLDFQKKKKALWIRDKGVLKGAKYTVIRGDFDDMFKLLRGHLKATQVFYQLKDGVLIDNEGRRLYQGDAPEFKVVKQMWNYVGFASWHWRKKNCYPEKEEPWNRITPGFTYTNAFSGRPDFATIVLTSGAANKFLGPLVASGQTYPGEPKVEPGSIRCLSFDKARFFIRGYDRNGEMIRGDTAGKGFVIELADGLNVTSQQLKVADKTSKSKDKTRIRVNVVTGDPSFGSSFSAFSSIAPACMWLLAAISFLSTGVAISRKHKLRWYHYLGAVTSTALLIAWYCVGLGY